MLILGIVEDSPMVAPPPAPLMADDVTGVATRLVDGRLSERVSVIVTRMADDDAGCELRETA